MKQHLSEITPKMFAHVNKVMEGNDEARKDQMAQKIVPKLIDKGIPTQFTGEAGGAIIFEVVKTLAEKNGITPSSGTNSEGSASV